MINCAACAYRDGAQCLIRNTEIGCFSYATIEEAQRREAACYKYAIEKGILQPRTDGFTRFCIVKPELSSRAEIRHKNNELRKCTVKQSLDKNYEALKAQGRTDKEIAEILYMDVSSLRRWRTKKERNRR